MNNLPAISIIIPVYNVQEYVAECVQSVMRQTYLGQMECIVVDDCGTDGSMAIVERLIAAYHGPIVFRILHHDHNRGLSAARNTGTEAATGDYIYYLDSDDYISPDCIATLVAPLADHAYDMVVGDLQMTGHPRSITFLPQEEGAVMGNEAIFSRFYYPRMIYVMAWNKLIKASLFRLYDLRFMEGQLHEDELWTYKCCLVIQQLYVCKHVTYYYRIREDSISADFSRQLRQRLDSCYATVDYVLSHPAAVSRALYEQCVVYYFGVYLRNVYDENFDFLADYRSLRRRFSYHPYRLLMAGRLTRLDVKRQLHFFLPPRLGYAYLKLKRLHKQR